jgi:hypothetical protein
MFLITSGKSIIQKLRNAFSQPRADEQDLTRRLEDTNREPNVRRKKHRKLRLKKEKIYVRFLERNQSSSSIENEETEILERDFEQQLYIVAARSLSSLEDREAITLRNYSIKPICDDDDSEMEVELEEVEEKVLEEMKEKKKNEIEVEEGGEDKEIEKMKKETIKMNGHENEEIQEAREKKKEDEEMEMIEKGNKDEKDEEKEIKVNIIQKEIIKHLEESVKEKKAMMPLNTLSGMGVSGSETSLIDAKNRFTAYHMYRKYILFCSNDKNAIVVKLWPSFSCIKKISFTVSVQPTILIEQLIGYGLYRYIELGFQPPPVWNIAMYSLKMVDEDPYGQVFIDDEVPAMERVRSLSQIALKQFALCEESGARERSLDAFEQKALLKIHLGASTDVCQIVTIDVPLDWTFGEILIYFCEKKRLPCEPYGLFLMDTVRTEIPLEKTLRQWTVQEIILTRKREYSGGDIFYRKQRPHDLSDIFGSSSSRSIESSPSEAQVRAHVSNPLYHVSNMCTCY